MSSYSAYRMMFQAWIRVSVVSGIAIAHGHGGRQGRQRIMRSALILLIVLQLLFSRFISFRVIAYFLRDHQRNRLLRTLPTQSLALDIVPTSTCLSDINYPHSSWQLPLVPVSQTLPPLPPAKPPRLLRPAKRPRPRGVKRDLLPNRATRIVSESLLPPDAANEATCTLMNPTPRPLALSVPTSLPNHHRLQVRRTWRPRLLVFEGSYDIVVTVTTQGSAAVVETIRKTIRRIQTWATAGGCLSCISM